MTIRHPPLSARKHDPKGGQNQPWLSFCIVCIAKYAGRDTKQVNYDAVNPLIRIVCIVW